MYKTGRILIATFAVAAVLFSGCKDDEETNYDCDEAFDVMYDEGCELWCGNDGYTVYINQCAWYDDNDPANFSEDLANDICDSMEDWGEDDGCEVEFQSMLNCLVAHADDDCADDCEDHYEDFLDCVD